MPEKQWRAYKRLEQATRLKRILLIDRKEIRRAKFNNRRVKV
ncbi:hypothetical protein [Desulfamplus magnetovallimortis]|nr:hypothetical protein [Desulfamplus magnetovallimortis]